MEIENNCYGPILDAAYTEINFSFFFSALGILSYCSLKYNSLREKSEETKEI